MAVILDGKKTAKEIRAELKAGLQALMERGLAQPCLAVLIVGSDPAARTYVTSKSKACASVGIRSIQIELPADASEEEVLARVRDLNRDPGVTGILVQLPLPPRISQHRVLLALDPAKDMDGFHPENAGRLVQGLPCPRPCTPWGVMELLHRWQVPIQGKHGVIVGRSNIVGKPMAHLLLGENATVTICHSRTKDLAQEVARGDIVVAAVGVPELVKGSWIKPGAAVLDVGQNWSPDGTVLGDVEFEPAAARAGWITPVPGGTGPMTVAMLLRNTIEAAAKALQP